MFLVTDLNCSHWQNTSFYLIFFKIDFLYLIKNDTVWLSNYYFYIKDMILPPIFFLRYLKFWSHCYVDGYSISLWPRPNLSLKSFSILGRILTNRSWRSSRPRRDHYSISLYTDGRFEYFWINICLLKIRISIGWWLKPCRSC